MHNESYRVRLNENTLCLKEKRLISRMSTYRQDHILGPFTGGFMNLVKTIVRVKRCIALVRSREYAMSEMRSPNLSYPNIPGLRCKLKETFKFK